MNYQLIKNGCELLSGSYQLLEISKAKLLKIAIRLKHNNRTILRFQCDSNHIYRLRKSDSIFGVPIKWEPRNLLSRANEAPCVISILYSHRNYYNELNHDIFRKTADLKRRLNNCFG